MPRKFISEQCLVTDRWISFDPLDDEIIAKLFKKDIREGEEKLMLAVLADAIEDFKKHVLSKDQRGQKLFQEAEEWFLEKDDDQLFSFEDICATLQLHPDYIRRGLLSWKKSKLTTHSVGRPRQGHTKLAKTLSTHRSDFPRRRRFANAARAYNNSSKPVADRIPRPNLRRLLVGLHVQGEPIWPAT